MKKIQVYLRSDGFRNTLSFMIRSIVSLFYKNSETVFLELPVVTLKETTKDTSIEFNFLEDINMLPGRFDRLQLLNVRDWYSRGSHCLVGMQKGEFISFAWSHVGAYKIHEGLTFILPENSGWVGPLFVDCHHRSKGINKQQVVKLLRESHFEYAYTSVGSWNIPSLRALRRIGFAEIGRIREITIFGWRIYVATKGEKLSEFLREI